MIARVKRFGADDSGVIAVWVAVSFLMVVSILALVIDLGYAYTAKRQLQAACDAAALAGCDAWIEDRNATNLATNEASAMVMRYKNGVTSRLAYSHILVDTTDTPTRSVRVRLFYPMRSLFGGLLGRETYQLRVAARAEMQLLSGARYVAPWGLTVFGRPTAATFTFRSSTGAYAGGTNMNSPDGLTWTGKWNAPAAPGAYDIMVRFQNDEGVGENLHDTYRSRDTSAARLFVRGPGQPVESVTWDRPLFTECDGSYGPTPGYQWPNITANINGATTTVLGKPATVSNTLLMTHEVKIESSTVAYVQQTRLDHPIKNVTASPIVANPNEQITVQVQFGGFDPRDRTQTMSGVEPRLFFLRQSDGSYTGDYVQLDLLNTNHYYCGRPAFNTSGMPNTWAEMVKTGYPGATHIGEQLFFNQTPSADRIDGFSSSRMVLPIVKRVSSAQVKVLGFVGFRKETVTDSGTTIRGTYEMYTTVPNQFTTGTVSPHSTSNAVYAARLVR